MVAKRNRKTSPLAGGKRMICPDCHGNGFLIENKDKDRQVHQCKTCNSEGEISTYLRGIRDLQKKGNL